jgi:hypothetical protein
MQVYKQKVKHLLYEHQNNITTLKADGELALKLQQDDFRKREGDFGKDKRTLKQELKEQVRGQQLQKGARYVQYLLPRVGTAGLL